MCLCINSQYTWVLEYSILDIFMIPRGIEKLCEVAPCSGEDSGRVTGYLNWRLWPWTWMSHMRHSNSNMTVVCSFLIHRHITSRSSNEWSDRFLVFFHVICALMLFFLPVMKLLKLLLFTMKGQGFPFMSLHAVFSAFMGVAGMWGFALTSESFKQQLQHD